HPARRRPRVSLRRLLRADGHDQGPAAARGAARVRQGSVDRVGADRPARAGCRVMLPLSLSGGEPVRRVLAVGCHADDIEIGCGGTLLTLTRASRDLEVTWVVLAARNEREREARTSAGAFLASAARSQIDIHGFRDSFLPYEGGEVKEVFQDLARRTDPQIVFTHTREDLHQD